MKVAVIGAGVMGPGIAQVFLLGGHQVSLSDVRQEALDAAIGQVERSLALMDEVGLAADTSACLARLETSLDLAAAVGGADLVVEAIPEVFELKRALYAQLDPLVEPDAVVVSNTSAFPLPLMLPDFRPGNFFVAHFLNPPAVVPLVEIVKNDQTDPDKVDWLRQVLRDCGKKPIVLNDFVKGFLVNRLQTALAREALSLVEQGLVSAEDLDTASIVGIGFKSAWQGFFETMDYIGLDTVAFVYHTIFPDLCNAGTVPAAVTDKVAAGQLGLKTGRGFLDYGDATAETEEHRLRVLLEQLKLYQQYG